jgi:hypothetical protein
MIILIDKEKALDKMQYPFMMKTASKLETEGSFLNLINSILSTLQLTSCFGSDILGTELRVSDMLGKHSNAELHPTGP